jgi:diguanylate cyclase (GGDEF)-like protein/PAS domain S-box-containing protein
MANPEDPQPGLPEPVEVTGSNLRALLSHVDAVVVTFAADGTILFVGPAIQLALGYQPWDLEGRNVAELMHPDDLVMLERWEGWIGRTGPSQEPDYRIRHADGSWVRMTIESVTGPDIAPFGSGLATVRRLDHASRAEQELRERLINEERLVRLTTTFMRIPIDQFDEGVQATLTQLGALKGVDRVSVWRRDGDVVRRTHHWVRPGLDEGPEPAPYPVEDGFLLETMLDAREVHISDSHALGDHEPAVAAMRAQGTRTLIAAPMLHQHELAGFLSFSSTAAIELNDPSHLSMLRSAAGLLAEAFARHDAERRLAFEARVDSITGLGNRWAFLDAVQGTLDRVKRGELGGLAILLLDLDRFKVVNDSLGHAIGDTLLGEVAARLLPAVHPDEQLARFGGDEIVVLLPGLAEADAAAARARTLTATLTAPFFLGGHEVYVTASGGIALATDSGRDADELIRRADAAMYLAKERGRQRVEVFDESLEQEIRLRLHRESELQRAVHDQQLRLHYQPEIELVSGAIVGAEALVRWAHPERGLLVAGEFIGIAEETGAILEIGEWVFTEACRQLAGWQAAGRDLTMRVNLSARQVNQPDLVPRLVDIIAETRIEPTGLCLEITETAVMADAELSLAVLEKLHALGLHLAIDDFGTGYSSLSYLKRFPVDVVKIDQSFIAGLGRDPDDSAIVRAILSMAEALGLTVTAEGVETDSQLAALQALGCPRAQGFLLGRPVPPDQLAALLPEI